MASHRTKLRITWLPACQTVVEIQYNIIQSLEMILCLTLVVSQVLCSRSKQETPEAEATAPAAEAVAHETVAHDTPHHNLPRPLSPTPTFHLQMAPLPSANASKAYYLTA